MNEYEATIQINPTDDIKFILEEPGCYESEIEMMKAGGTYDGTHTKKNGSVNVEFKTPSKSGKKSTSLKKLKIIKTISPMRSAWDKVS